MRSASHWLAIASIEGQRSDAKTCKVRGSQDSRLRVAWADDTHAKEIGLQLHQHVVSGCPTVHAQLLERKPRVGLHCVEHIDDLERDAFKSRTGDVCPRRSAGHSDEGTARVLVPVRGSEAGERGDEHDAARVGNG